MDEQEKKYQDLFTELTNYERSGVRMQMNGFPASPLQIVSAHMVREESNYMRDYILDEQGMIRELDFNSIETDHSQVELKSRAPSPGHDLWGMEIVLRCVQMADICGIIT